MAIRVGGREVVVALGGVAAGRPRVFLLCAAVLSQVFLTLAYAQQADKPPSVGVILTSPLTSSHYQAFLQGLRDLGYVEGKNITVVAKSGEGDPNRFPDFARELVRLNVNVMVAGGDQGLRAAKEATGTIPIPIVALRSAR